MKPQVMSTAISAQRVPKFCSGVCGDDAPMLTGLLGSVGSDQLNRAAADAKFRLP
jgi:hypothetical protein